MSTAAESQVKNYVIAQPPQAAIPVAGIDKYFPVRRLWCVGRNYVEHIKEMGQDVREPPFFFAKPADAIVPDGGTVPYPSPYGTGGFTRKVTRRAPMKRLQWRYGCLSTRHI